jgi:tRNA1(Val) A37 N6-methylase TrmN6
VIVRQFESGFRSGLDAVMLAAAVPARAGNEVLELGSGAGVASLCLATRVSGASLVGAEIESSLVALANRNATANGFGDRVVFVTVDALDLPVDMRREFDHVFTNPPFHGGDGHLPPDAQRAEATHDHGALAEWLAVGMKRTRSGGTFTCVFRVDRLGEALAALPPTGLTLLPLFPRAGETAKRMIVQVVKGSRAPLSLLPGLVLHQADGGYTAEADSILRVAKNLSL